MDRERCEDPPPGEDVEEEEAAVCDFWKTENLSNTVYISISERRIHIGDRVETLSERRGRDLSQRWAERQGSQNRQSGKIPPSRIPDRRQDGMWWEEHLHAPRVIHSNLNYFSLITVQVDHQSLLSRLEMGAVARVRLCKKQEVARWLGNDGCGSADAKEFAWIWPFCFVFCFFFSKR